MDLLGDQPRRERNDEIRLGDADAFDFRIRICRRRRREFPREGPGAHNWVHNSALLGTCLHVLDGVDHEVSAPKGVLENRVALDAVREGRTDD